MYGMAWIDFYSFCSFAKTFPSNLNMKLYIATLPLQETELTPFALELIRDEGEIRDPNQSP